MRAARPRRRRSPGGSGSRGRCLRGRARPGRRRRRFGLRTCRARRVPAGCSCCRLLGRRLCRRWGCCCGKGWVSTRGGRGKGEMGSRSMGRQEKKGRPSAYCPPRRIIAPAASTSGQPDVHLTGVLGVPQTTVLFGQPDAVEYWRKSWNRSRRSWEIPVDEGGISDCWLRVTPVSWLGFHLPSVSPGRGRGTAATRATRPSTVVDVKCILSCGIERLELR